LVVAEYFRDVVVRVGGWAGPGFVVHVAELHLLIGVGPLGGVADEARCDVVAGDEVQLGEGGLDVE